MKKSFFSIFTKGEKNFNIKRYHVTYLRFNTLEQKRLLILKRDSEYLLSKGLIFNLVKVFIVFSRKY